MAFDKLKNTVLENKNIIIPALGAIGGAIAGLAAYNTISSLATSFSLFKNAVMLAWNTLLAHPMLAVTVAIGALVGAFITAYKTNDEFRESVNRIWEKIKNALTPVIETLGKVLSWLWQEVVIPLSDVLNDILKVAFEGISYSVEWLWKYILEPLGQFLFAVFSPIIDFLGKLLINVLKFSVELVTKAFEFLWYSVLKPITSFLQFVFKPIFETVGKAIKDIIGGMQMTFEGFIMFISGIFTANWKKAWEGVKTIFKGIFTSLWTIAKTPLNLIIDAMNLVIEGLNSISIDIPDWVPKYGGQTFGINIPTIPKLAKGGIIKQPTLAMVGERGKEAVMPLENNTGWIDELAMKIASLMGGQGVGETAIIVKIGEDTIIEKVVSGINRQSRISGKTIIEV
jgi:phage-related protein